MVYIWSQLRQNSRSFNSVKIYSYDEENIKILTLNPLLPLLYLKKINTVLSIESDINIQVHVLLFFDIWTKDDNTGCDLGYPYPTLIRFVYMDQSVAKGHDGRIMRDDQGRDVEVPDIVEGLFETTHVVAVERGEPLVDA